MKPIYAPAGRAREYSEDGDSNLALNIYNGCPHGCLYCYAPLVLKRMREAFHACCEPRPGVVEATRKQLESGVLIEYPITHESDKEQTRERKVTTLTGKSVFLCFTCDPFPAGVSHEPTYQIIELLKKHGNSVQILTKSFPDDMNRLCSLLDENDRYGISYTEDSTALEPNAPRGLVRYQKLQEIKKSTDCKSFLSCEPVVNKKAVLGAIKWMDSIDQFRIGKLNYEWLLPPELRPNIDWGAFGREAERLCIKYERRYLIKEDLRKAMGTV